MTETRNNNVTIAVTGLGWMGGGTRSTRSIIQEMLSAASDEIQIMAYAITEGAEGLIKIIKNALSRGVIVTIVVNRFNDQPIEVQAPLLELSRRYLHFNLFNFSPDEPNEDLHAKVLVVDRRRAMVGSSNLSWKGLTFNHELAVLIEGTASARISCLIDTLTKDKRTKPVRLTGTGLQ